MARRSTSQRDMDDHAFPIRVKVKVQPDGFGGELERLSAWLMQNVPHGDFAKHPAPALGGSAIGYHFRRIEDAAAFLRAFPHLELADGTT